jgi:hypothetical protein
VADTSTSGAPARASSRSLIPVSPRPKSGAIDAWHFGVQPRDEYLNAAWRPPRVEEAPAQGISDETWISYFHTAQDLER